MLQYVFGFLLSLREIQLVRISIFRIALSLSIIFVSLTGFARITSTTGTITATNRLPSFDELPKEKLVIRENGVDLHGYFIPGRPNQQFSGKKSLVTHGLFSNLHEFEYVIPRLHEAGFDVTAFNVRGHGNGEDQSLVLNYEEGDYRLEKMAEIDFPLMVKAAQRGTRKKIYVIGHSMGGMIPRAAFAHGSITEKQIQSLILLGSPPHLNGRAAVVRRAQNLLVELPLSLYLNSGPGDGRVNFVRNALVTTNLINDFSSLFPFHNLRKRIATAPTRALARRELGPIVDEESTESWANRAVTHSLPKDILRSFADYAKDGYPYEHMAIPVPILHIMGEIDNLVAWQDIVTNARVQSLDAGHWLIRVKKVGHFGLVAPWVIDGLMDRILTFIDSPHKLGPMNETFLEFSPKGDTINDCAHELASIDFSEALARTTR